MQIHRYAVLGLAAFLIAAAPAHPRTPVALVPQPGTAMDRTARELVGQELAEAGQSGEKPLLLVAASRLGGPHDRPALFVQLQSARECGSAGCSTSVYRWDKGRWQKVLDAVSGPIAVDTASHGGMRDLIVHDTDRWIWNGHAYADANPAPQVDLKPRQANRK